RQEVRDVSHAAHVDERARVRCAWVTLVEPRRRQAKHRLMRRRILWFFGLRRIGSLGFGHVVRSQSLDGPPPLKQSLRRTIASAHTRLPALLVLKIGRASSLRPLRWTSAAPPFFTGDCG